MIPLFVDLAGKRILIFGGGKVAARKAALFAKEADVTVVSRSHSEPLRALPVTLMTRDVVQATDRELEEILDCSFAVIAALPERNQNERIGALCKRKGILFNNAGGEPGDLIIPSISSGKKFTIAITTRGKSPAISRLIREHIDDRFSMLDRMIDLQDVLRRELRTTQRSQEQRRNLLWKVLSDDEIWEALERSGNEAERMARRKYLHE